MMRKNSSNGFQNKDQQICRICLSEEEPENLLINPCSCTGSMKYIHETCLREWLEGKKHMKETEVVNSYIWKNLECEICKTSYADLSLIPSLKDGSKEFNILNYKIHEDAKSYMVIESVTNTTSKTIHVINFSLQKKIKVVSSPIPHKYNFRDVPSKQRLELQISVSVVFIL
jgi:RING-variant domain